MQNEFEKSPLRESSESEKSKPAFLPPLSSKEIFVSHMPNLYTFDKSPSVDHFSKQNFENDTFHKIYRNPNSKFMHKHAPKLHNLLERCDRNIEYSKEMVLDANYQTGKLFWIPKHIKYPVKHWAL